MADSLHRPSIYPQLIHLKKTGSGEIACSFHSLVDIGYVTVIQENLLGTAVRELGEEVEMNPLS